MFSILFFVCMLPFADPWIDQCATAANQGDRTVPDADEADFSQSVMIGPNKIREGDTIDCEIILRNTGSKRPDYVALGIGTGSSIAMLASAPELTYNPEKRELHWRGTVEPGEELHFTFRFVTIPKSAGTWTSAYASVVWGSWVSTH